jgi:hypothetical protein
MTMALLIVVAAILVSVVLEQQERRFYFEICQRCEKLGWEFPERLPKTPLLESLLSIVLGLILFVIGGFFLWIVMHLPEQYVSTGLLEFVALFVSSGIAVIILGSRAIKFHLRAKKA